MPLVGSIQGSDLTDMATFRVRMGARRSRHF